MAEKLNESFALMFSGRCGACTQATATFSGGKSEELSQLEDRSRWVAAFAAVEKSKESSSNLKTNKIGESLLTSSKFMRDRSSHSWAR